MTDLPKETLSPNQIQLFKTLGVAITRRLKILLERQVDVGSTEDQYFHHGYQSAFEKACIVLWRLDISFGAKLDASAEKRVPFEENTFYPYFLLLCDDEISQRLERGFPDYRPLTSDLITAYLEVSTDYGGPSAPFIPTAKGKPFLPQYSDQFEPLEALALNGYAEKIGDQFIWTEKVAIIMIKLCCWDENDMDDSNLDRNWVLDQTHKIKLSLKNNSLSEIPFDCIAPDVPINLTRLSVAWRASEIMRLWTGETWSKKVLSDPAISFDQAMGISLKIEKGL